MQCFSLYYVYKGLEHGNGSTGILCDDLQKPLYHFPSTSGAQDDLGWAFWARTGYVHARLVVCSHSARLVFSERLGNSIVQVEVNALQMSRTCYHCCTWPTFEVALGPVIGSWLEPAHTWSFQPLSPCSKPSRVGQSSQQTAPCKCGLGYK